MTIEVLQVEQDQYIEYFRVHGKFQTNKADALEVKLLEVVNDSTASYKCLPHTS